ncbi:hypothetical protein F5B19DRAFT_491249 [Rostrohypoxylon terebratum]|nr:hypothetical protein F5B19DRAFT_491249 [Rostrohypoxylon terebratum]
MDSTKAPNAIPSSPPRRRGSGPTFEGLMNAKRSNESSSMARRASLHDQKPQTGFLGQMWHSFTRGPQSPTK